MSQPLIYCTVCNQSAYEVPPAVHRCVNMATLEPRKIALILASITTEDEATSLFFALSRKFQWCGTPVLMGDVDVHPVVPDDEGEDDEPIWDVPADIPMTQAMKDAVADTYEWRKGITERLSEVAAELLPTVYVSQDGSFEVVAFDSQSTRYSPGGSRQA